MEPRKNVLQYGEKKTSFHPKKGYRVETTGRGSGYTVYASECNTGVKCRGDLKKQTTYSKYHGTSTRTRIVSGNVDRSC